MRSSEKRRIMSSIELEYFSWLKDKVCGKQGHNYDMLLNALHNVEYIFEYEMDSNRAADGYELRYRFGYECDYLRKDIEAISNYCSMLEMMVALAIRMEEDIMVNLEYGDRTGQWFWGMIRSLGLGKMTDHRFNQRKFDSIIDIFMNHEYDSDGHGGLFAIEDCEYDLTKEEIWTQMNWYLNTLEE